MSILGSTDFAKLHQSLNPTITASQLRGTAESAAPRGADPRGVAPKGLSASPGGGPALDLGLSGFRV